MGRVRCDNWMMDVLRYHPDHIASNPAARFSMFAEPVQSAITPTGMFQPGLATEIMRKLFLYDPFAEIGITQELEDVIHTMRIDI